MNTFLIGCSYVKWAKKGGNPNMKKPVTGLFALTLTKNPTKDSVAKAVAVLDPTVGNQTIYVRGFTALPIDGARNVPSGLDSVLEQTITKHVPMEETVFVRA